MAQSNPIKNYEYSGVLAVLCEEFIAEKRAMGYKYNSAAQNISEFSRFSENFEVPENSLPKELVLAWIAPRPTDTGHNPKVRYSNIRQLADYMQRNGYEAYCPEKSDFGRATTTFIPYIFTHDEIRRFFGTFENVEFKDVTRNHRNKVIMPVLFRLLYCCGLRCSEATGLLGEDVNYTNGVLLIRNAKFGKSRYVPLSLELIETLRRYNENRRKSQSDVDFLFAAPDGGEYTEYTIYWNFRKHLRLAGIPHGGRGNGPRLHDFRHTFSVHCLQNIVSQGKNLTNALSRLSSILGHENLQATERYLRMTAEVYPEIAALLQEKYGKIIPKEAFIQYEND